jgi:transposase
MFEQNSLERIYVLGKSTPELTRARIIQLYSQGLCVSQISDDVKLTTRGVSKIINSYVETGSILPKVQGGKNRSVLTDDVLRQVELYKTRKPSTYAREIREKLVTDNICNVNNVPSRRTIAHAINNELIFTRKHLSVIPSESLKPASQEKLMDYFDNISEFPARSIHFMDEASVIRTTGNRHYGHAFVGQPATEVCRYSSDANFTVNLLCGYFGVDYYNIVEGPSNGMELLQFFDEALEQTYENGNPILGVGDAVVLDNCGFHHARHVEGVLREMLFQNGVRYLLYQPPYCPELNPCEYCFAHMKGSLRNNERFTSLFTELAIVNALELIKPAFCAAFFETCGYVR